MALVHGLDLALQLRDLGGLGLGAASAHEPLEVFGHAEKLQLARAVHEVLGLHFETVVVPGELRNALAEVAHLPEQLELALVLVADLGVKGLDPAAVDEGTVSVVRDDGSGGHLDLSLAQADGDVDVDEILRGAGQWLAE